MRSSRLTRAVLRCHPRAWRARYGDEALALVEDTGDTWRALLDLARGALSEHRRQVVVRVFGQSTEQSTVGRRLFVQTMAWLALGFAGAAIAMWSRHWWSSVSGLSSSRVQAVVGWLAALAAVRIGVTFLIFSASIARHLMRFVTQGRRALPFTQPAWAGIGAGEAVVWSVGFLVYLSLQAVTDPATATYRALAVRSYPFFMMLGLCSRRRKLDENRLQELALQPRLRSDVSRFPLGLGGPGRTGA